MVNPEIITALKNALDRGESLEEAKQVLISSGYNLAEIQEASRFVGGGTISMQQAKPGEELTMPRKKGFFGKFAKTTRPQPATVTMPNPPQQMPTSQIPPQQMPVQQSTPQPVSTNQIQRLVQQPLQSQQPAQPQTTTQPPSTQLSDPQATQQLQSLTHASPPEIKPSEFPIPQDGELTKEIRKIKPKGPSHAKEIILFAILLVLITILILSFIFRNKIVNLFAFLLPFFL